jgi:putative DNA primase/helicase
MATCPIHDDGKSSLSIDEKDGRLLVKCMAGCDQGAVIDALKNRGLWPDSTKQEQSTKRKIVATYDYSLDGKLIFQAVRYEPKGFSQRRPDGTGGWIYNLQGIDPFPYNLGSVQASEWCVIVEGEKDVENLKAIGIPATCNPMGAGKWRDSYNKYFTGKKVVILTDNDEPGRKHAQDVARNLNGVAASVKVVALPGLPQKGDVSDWLQNPANTKQVLFDIIKNTPEWEQTSDPCDERFTDEWQEPLLFGDIETPEISPASLPEPLAGYCKAVSESAQTPPAMAVMVGLAAVATCLQKRFEISPFGDSYTEPVNLMTVTALDPASRKSAIVKAMTEPLTAWEVQQADAVREPAARVRHERDMLIKSIDSIKSTASKTSATDDDRRAALTEIRRLEDSMPTEIIAPRLWIDDVTPERLQGLMAENGERISIISAEGGIFEVVAGLYSGGNSNINVILQSHAGEPVRVERQGRSVMMLKPALTFGLTVQPDIISNLATGNKARFRGNGMLARLLYCIPKSTVGSRDVTKRRPVPEKIRHEYHALLYRLLAIPPILDEQGNEQPRMLTLAPDALGAWLAFSQYIESNQGQYGDFHSIQDWTGKLPGAALRIAGLCHVVEHGEVIAVISKATIERTLDLVELLIVHAKAAFALMGTDPAIPDAKYILRWIVSNGTDSFRRGDLHKATHGRFQRVDRLISALKVLTERHIISDPQERPTGRRPEIVYIVNPSILKGGHHGLA